MYKLTLNSCLCIHLQLKQVSGNVTKIFFDIAVLLKKCEKASFLRLQWNDDEQGRESTSCLNIPNLADIGSVPYGRIIVPVLLQVCIGFDPILTKHRLKRIT